MVIYQNKRLHFLSEPPTVTSSLSYIEAVYNDNITLQCTVNSAIPIIESFWNTVTQGQIDVDISSTMDMTYESVTFAYTGLYRCCVANKLHVKQCDQILVNVTGGKMLQRHKSFCFIKISRSQLRNDCNIFSVYEEIT